MYMYLEFLGERHEFIKINEINLMVNILHWQNIKHLLKQMDQILYAKLNEEYSNI